MKKLFAILASALILAVAAAPAFAASPSKSSSSKKSAPVKENGAFIGGSMGFTFSNLGNGGNNQNGVSFNFIADGGYQINKTFGVGMQLGYSHGIAALGAFDITDVKAFASSMVGAVTDVSDMNINGFTFAPYARINIISGKVVDLFIEPGLTLSLATISNTPSMSGFGFGGDDDDDDKKDDDDDDGGFDLGGIGGGDDVNVLFGFGLIARPGVCFKLDEHFRLFTKFGALGFMLGSKATVGSDEAPTTLARFGFDVSTSNLMVGVQFRF